MSDYNDGTYICSGCETPCDSSRGESWNCEDQSCQGGASVVWLGPGMTATADDHIRCRCVVELTPAPIIWPDIHTLADRIAEGCEASMFYVDERIRSIERWASELRPEEEEECRLSSERSILHLKQVGVRLLKRAKALRSLRDYGIDHELDTAAACGVLR